MKKPLIIAIIGAAALAGIGTVALPGSFLAWRFLAGNEDTWLCKNNQWIKHGNPSSPPPAEGCGQKPLENSSQGQFSHIGVAVKNQPGLEENSLYLLYEQPGRTALRTKLIFDGNSTCGDAERSIVCMALSVSDYGLYNGRKVQVEGMQEADAVRVKKLTYLEQYARPEIYGYIKSASSAGGKFFLDIDQVEFLSGPAAVEAGSRDTGCAKERIEECIPSMNNNFYIRNITKDTITYPVSSTASIRVMASPGSPVLTFITFQQLKTDLADPKNMLDKFPFRFMLGDGELIEIEEQYLP